MDLIFCFSIIFIAFFHLLIYLFIEHKWRKTINQKISSLVLIVEGFAERTADEREEIHEQKLQVIKGMKKSSVSLRLAPAPKTIFHPSVILYTCSQSNSDGSVSATRVRLAFSIWYDTLMYNCFNDWSQSKLA